MTVELVSSPPAAKKALIMVMPFATPEFPGLGATLIRSILVSAQIPTDIVYGNLVFSKLIDADPFVENSLSELPICELAFTPYYFGTDIREAAESLRGYVLELAMVQGAHTRERYVEIVENAGRTIDWLFESIAWQDYDVVGFSLLMGQTVASLALAKRIKAAHPEIVVIVGGAHTQPPMGDEMLRSFPEIDFVLQGEADGIVAPFIKELRQGVRTHLSTPGVLFRDEHGQIRLSGEAPAFTDLESLPVPDFTDFFAQMEALGLTHIQPYMPIETSRGCWWGQKHHCTFCGIDDKIMVFRSKSAVRVLNEILELSQRHHYTEFFAVDSIIDLKFFSELLPTIGDLRRQHAWDFTFFFESKSNITRDQVRRFRYGGVNHVQPGLESFSDHVLELMDKGTSGVRQIQCLKFLAEYNIIADWNLIYCNPGETAEDYRESIDLIPFLHHLPYLHAGGLIPMQINRYAPYHNQPQRYAIGNIRPKRYYPLIYPDPSINLDQLAFYFDCDFDVPTSEELKEQYAEFKHRIDTWRECYVPDALVQAWGPGFVKIVDRRSWQPEVPIAPGEERTYMLNGVAAQIFAFCNELSSTIAVSRAFSDVAAPAEIAELIDQLVELRLMYRSPSGQLISLPIFKEAEGRFRFVPGESRRNNSAERQAVDSAPRETGVVLIEQAVATAAYGRPFQTSLGVSVHPPFGQVRMTIGSSDDQPIPIRLDRLAPNAIPQEITKLSELTQSLRFRLEGLETDDGGIDRTVLESLADARAERLLSYDLDCELTIVPSAEIAWCMREAGISSVVLSEVLGSSEGSAILSNLMRIAAAKNLGAADIAVVWQLDPRTEFLGVEQRRQMQAICDASRHIPPPVSGGADIIAGMAHRWSACHKPRSLTYARGPGFLRVFDRRTEEGRWRFISFNDSQGEILLRCSQPKDFGSLLSEVPNTNDLSLRQFLETLVEQNVMCRGLNDHYLALPIRRSIDERWASVTTEPSSALNGSGPRVILLRIAGMTADVLESFQCATVLKCAQVTERTLDQLQVRAPARCNAIHALVPGKSAATRRALLDLKRAVHNQRPLQLDSLHLEAILARANGLTDDIKGWADDIRTYQKSMDRGAAAVQEDWEKVRRSLAGAWNNELLKRGVLYAQPEVYRGLAKRIASFQSQPKTSKQRERRWELSLLTYVYRMTTKTSPFSTFTVTAVGEMNDDMKCFPLPDVQSLTSSLIVSPALIGTMARRWLAHPDFAPRTPLYPPDLVESDGGRITFLTKADPTRNGEPDNEIIRTLSDSTISELVLRLLDEARGAHTITSLRQLLAQKLGCEEAALAELLVQLQALGLIRPTLSYDGSRLYAMAGLAQKALALGGATIERGPKLAAAAVKVLQSAAGRPAAEQARGLEAALSDIKTVVGDAVDVPAAHSVFDRCALSEVVSLPARAIRWVTPMLQQLLGVLPLFNLDLGAERLVQDFFRDQCRGGQTIPILEAFAKLREFVEARYPGESGDPFNRATEQHAAVNAATLKRQALIAELRGLMDRTTDGPADVPHDFFQRWSQCANSFEPRRTRLSANFLGQFLATYKPDRPYFVLNSVLIGYGALAATWAQPNGHPAGQHLRTILLNDLAALDPEGDVAEIAATLDFGGQVREQLTPLVLFYPNELFPADSAHVIEWSELGLGLDDTLDRITLVRRDSGRRVLPLHLGTISPFHFPPFYRFLVALGPAFTPTFSLIDLIEAELSESERQALRHYRRTLAGPIVLSRETWCVPAGSLPRLHGGTLSYSEFLDLRKWARSLGLTRRVFVTSAQTVDIVRDNLDFQSFTQARKPFYLDFDNYSSCVLFSRFTRRPGPTLRFSEMLPAPEENPFREHELSRTVECALEIQQEMT